MSTSPAIAWSLDSLDPTNPVRDNEGTYSIRICQEADPRPPSSLRQVRVRADSRRTGVLPWQTVSWDLETKLRKELISYTRLPDNWDGEGNKTPIQTAVDDALTFLDSRPDDVPLPYPDPGTQGGVGIYWENTIAQVFVEAVFEGDGMFSYFAVHGLPGAIVDKCGSDDVDVTAPWPDDMLRILRIQNST